MAFLVGPKAVEGFTCCKTGNACVSFGLSFSISLCTTVPSNQSGGLYPRAQSLLNNSPQNPRVGLNPHPLDISQWQLNLNMSFKGDKPRSINSSSQQQQKRKLIFWCQPREKWKELIIQIVIELQWYRVRNVLNLGDCESWSAP